VSLFLNSARVERLQDLGSKEFMEQTFEARYCVPLMCLRLALGKH